MGFKGLMNTKWGKGKHLDCLLSSYILIYVPGSKIASKLRIEVGSFVGGSD